MLNSTNEVEERLSELENILGVDTIEAIKEFDCLRADYNNGHINYEVRGKKLSVPSQFRSLSGSMILQSFFTKLYFHGDKYPSLETQMFQVTFHTHQEFFPPRELMRTLKECLQEKVDPKDQ